MHFLTPSTISPAEYGQFIEPTFSKDIDSARHDQERRNDLDRFGRLSAQVVVQPKASYLLQNQANLTSLLGDMTGLYFAPEQNKPLPPLQTGDEVLVVNPLPSNPQGGGAPPQFGQSKTTNFATLKHGGNHDEKKQRGAS